MCMCVCVCVCVAPSLSPLLLEGGVNPPGERITTAATRGQHLSSSLSAWPPYGSGHLSIVYGPIGKKQLRKKKNRWRGASQGRRVPSFKCLLGEVRHRIHPDQIGFGQGGPQKQNENLSLARLLWFICGIQKVPFRVGDSASFTFLAVSRRRDARFADAGPFFCKKAV